MTHERQLERCIDGLCMTVACEQGLRRRSSLNEEIWHGSLRPCCGEVDVLSLWPTQLRSQVRFA